MQRSALLRRTPFKSAAASVIKREAKQCTYTPRPRAVAQPADVAPAVLKAVPKDACFESEAWRRAVASLPCVFCGSPDTQAAHRNEGKGKSLKTDDSLTAALCQAHHSAIDQGKDMLREERRAEMDRAIVLTVKELARRGWIRVTTERDALTT